MRDFSTQSPRTARYFPPIGGKLRSDFLGKDKGTALIRASGSKLRLGGKLVFFVCTGITKTSQPPGAAKAVPGFSSEWKNQGNFRYRPIAVLRIFQQRPVRANEAVISTTAFGNEDTTILDAGVDYSERKCHRRRRRHMSVYHSVPNAFGRLAFFVLIGILTIGARHGFCSNLEFPEPGVSVITLKGVKIVITERACGDRHCGIEGSGVLQPNSEVSSIVVEVGHKRYSLNVKGMYDAWGGGRNESLKTKNRRFGATCYNPSNCVIRAVIGDGIWTAAVQWEISDGKSSRTVFTSSPDVISLFIADIDPPGNVYY